MLQATPDARSRRPRDLAEELAPQVELHPTTALRYIREWQESAA